MDWHAPSSPPAQTWTPAVPQVVVHWLLSPSVQAAVLPLSQDIIETHAPSAIRATITNKILFMLPSSDGTNFNVKSVGL